MVNKTWQKWTNEEIELLKVHWPKATMEELISVFPNRKYNSIMQKAGQLKVKSETNRARRGSFEFLDNLNKNSAYWWGFIMADGHISKRGELAISISSKDKDHLLKLANHLNTKIITRLSKNSYNNGFHEMSNLVLGDKVFGKKWLSILEINDKKTYYPPNLNIFLNKELFIYFFIGLVDGDGCIWLNGNKKNPWPNLRIELHINWFDTLQLISNKLKEFYDIECKVKVTKKNTSKLEINTKKDLNILKEFSNNCLDKLERKWFKL